MFLFGLPADHIGASLELINNVTLKEVNRALAQHLRPKNLTIVLVGPAAGLKRQLADTGIDNVQMLKP